jgi:hypothetical protein
VAKIGPVKPVRKTTPFKAGSPVSVNPVRKGVLNKVGKPATNKPPVGKGLPNKVGKPVAAKPVRKGEVLNPRAVAAKKKALELVVGNKRLVDVKKKNQKLIDMKKERLNRVTSVKAKKIVEKIPARKSLGGGTSRRASY